MSTPAAPTGFYAASATAIWGTTPLTPIEAKSLIPAELQSGLKLYIKLFPPPPPGSWWQEYAPIIASVAIFAVGAVALSAIGTAGAATAATTAASSTGAASGTIATATTAATTTTATTTGLTAEMTSAYGALQTGAGYIAPALGVVGKITGNTTAKKLSNLASAISKPSAAKALNVLTQNLAASQMPVGMNLTPAQRAQMQGLIQQKQQAYINSLNQQAFNMNRTGSTSVSPLSLSSNHIMTYGIIGGAALVALKVGGLL